MKTSPPAFPSSPVIGANGDLLRPVDIGCDGITIRDYFAAKAMQLILSDVSWHGHTCQTAANMAYEMADAMLEARNAA